ncbi:hydrolase [Marinobacterium arenosum]|uniref:hydrolase n=1 Tax=Marinobacterium arenosum TaxID=2862496 RepID=UPI001C942072|nr:hydrolase [Marinobacterium arenosum]MBY4678129.1 hydrolase [Marinobacterium arenosum]
MLIHPDKSCLLVVDIQEKLAPKIHDSEQLIANAKWLIEIANRLRVPVLTSEQYPQGLGHTVAELRPLLPAVGIMEKTHFSCMSEPACNAKINQLRPDQLVVIGSEAHVCVLQTAIQLKQQAREVYVVEDAVGSRNPTDKAAALARMRQLGIHVVTREMVAFEWLQKAGTEQFRQISREFLR